MAYDRARDRAIWKLENFPEFPGLTVRVRYPSLAAERVMRTMPGQLRRDATLRALQSLGEALGSALVSWDLQFDGSPVPATPAGVLSMDREFVLTLLSVWAREVVFAAPAAETSEPEPVADETELLGFDPADMVMEFGAAPAEDGQLALVGADGGAG